MDINTLLLHREVSAATELKNNGVEEQKEMPGAAAVETEGSGKSPMEAIASHVCKREEVSEV